MFYIKYTTSADLFDKIRQVGLSTMADQVDLLYLHNIMILFMKNCKNIYVISCKYTKSTSSDTEVFNWYHANIHSRPNLPLQYLIDIRYPLNKCPSGRSGQLEHIYVISCKYCQADPARWQNRSRLRYFMDNT